MTSQQFCWPAPGSEPGVMFSVADKVTPELPSTVSCKRHRRNGNWVRFSYCMKLQIIMAITIHFFKRPKKIFSVKEVTRISNTISIQTMSVSFRLRDVVARGDVDAHSPVQLAAGVIGSWACDYSISTWRALKNPTPGSWKEHGHRWLSGGSRLWFQLCKASVFALARFANAMESLMNAGMVLKYIWLLRNKITLFTFFRVNLLYFVKEVIMKLLSFYSLVRHQENK